MGLTLDKHIMTPDIAYRSFRNYEKQLDGEVRAGRMEPSEARHHIEAARKNYRSLNLNREIEKLKR